MLLIDTNIFLEVLLARGKKENCKKLLRRLRDGKETGVLTDFSVHSIIVIMDAFRKIKELETFLSSLSAYKGLHVFYTSLAVEIEAAGLALEKGLDMDDAVQYSASLSAGAEYMVSYDKHFDNLEVPRKTPEELIESSQENPRF